MNEEAPEVSPRNDDSVVDWQAALETVDNNRKLLCDLVDIFLREGPRLLERLERAIDVRAAKELQLSAHSLKGSLRYFRTARATDAAYRVERAAAKGQIDQAEQELAELKAAVQQVVDCLRSTEVPYPRDVPPEARPQRTS